MNFSIILLALHAVEIGKIIQNPIFIHLLHSLLMTYNNEHRYILYVVVDDDDPIYSNAQEKIKYIDS